MKLSKRQQRLRAKQIAETGLNEAGKLVYKVKDINKHLNKNLRPNGPFANKPFVRADNPELLNDRGKLAHNYITKYPGASRNNRKNYNNNRNYIHQIIEANPEHYAFDGEKEVLIEAKPRKVIHHDPVPIKIAKAELLTYGFHALKP